MRFTNSRGAWTLVYGLIQSTRNNAENLRKRMYFPNCYQIFSTALNGIKKSETIIDAALILFDPSCVNLILLEVEKELRQILKVQGFPKGSEKIDFLMRMLRIGTSAPEMAADNSTSEPNLDRSIISRLLKRFEKLFFFF